MTNAPGYLALAGCADNLLPTHQMAVLTRNLGVQFANHQLIWQSKRLGKTLKGLTGTNAEQSGL